MPTMGSFAQRMAAHAANSNSTPNPNPTANPTANPTSASTSTPMPAVESWDDDADFTGDLFASSTTTAQSTSSRVSVRSESNFGDDDWQVLLAPNDALSTLNAITSAKQAGIPIPTSVPSSALLGGAIKRLGGKRSSRKIAVDDDWGEDLELPLAAGGRLELKAPPPRTPADDNDDFDDWGEGSLGIRFGGTRRETRGGRSSSVSASAMSPSLGSCMTLESEDDDMTGLLLPNEPLDFPARLEKLKKTEHPAPDVSPVPAQQKRELPPTSVPAPAPTPIPAPQLAPSPLPPPIASHTPPGPKPDPEDGDDQFLDGLDFADDALDSNKLTLNPKVVVNKQPPKPVTPTAARAATTLTFTDKQSTSRIPRPLPSTRSRLTPVYESGAPALGHSRQMPTTTSAQLLRAKRSAPMLRNTYGSVSRPPVPFLPAGNSNAQSHHVMSKASQGHLRRDSDPRRPHSPSMRSYSRMSATNPPDTPSRAGMRKDIAPAAVAREGGLKRTLSKPRGQKKVFGDGTELEIFDDLPTSATKEKQFERQPKNSLNKTLRHLPSNTRLPMVDRMSTPLPQTPRSPTKIDTTPRFARDTAASRIAREQRLAGTRSRGEGPIAPTQTNWKAQVAARSPHTSPTAHRKRGSGAKPSLIQAMSAPIAKNEKGMTYNPSLQRWEGNEEALVPFSHPNTSTTTLALTTASTPTFAPPSNQFQSHDRSRSISHTALSNIHASQKMISSRAVKVNAGPAPSPPRPALISQSRQPRLEKVNGMIFDPVKMSWAKEQVPRAPGDRRPPSVNMDDEEDPFSGIEDLKDHDGLDADGAADALEAGTFVGEEFDLGPSFIRRQREEEVVWRKRTERWVGGLRDNGDRKIDGWRWQIRNFAALASTETARR